MAIVFCPGTDTLKNVPKVELSHHGNITIEGPAPFITQDGGWEIHPLLKGITFCFWVAPGSPECWVNFEGAAGDAPWASQLTGFKATDGFGEAKGFLRDQAWKLAREAGFKFNAQEHGYRWL